MPRRMGAVSDTHGMEARIRRPDGTASHASGEAETSASPDPEPAPAARESSEPRLGGSAGNPPPLAAIFGGEEPEQRLGGSQGRPPPLASIFGDAYGEAPRLGGSAGNPPPLASIFGEEYVARLGGSQGNPPPMAQMFGGGQGADAARLGGSQGRPPPLAEIFGEEYVSRLGGSQGRPPPLADIFGAEYAAKLGGSQGRPPPLAEIFGEEYAAKLGGSQGRPPPLAEIYGEEYAAKLMAKQSGGSAAATSATRTTIAAAAAAGPGGLWAQLLGRAERAPPTSVDLVFHSVGKVQPLGGAPLDLSSRGGVKHAVEARSFKKARTAGAADRTCCRANAPLFLLFSPARAPTPPPDGRTACSRPSHTLRTRTHTQELILLSTTAERLAEALNSVVQLRRLGFEHYLLLAEVVGTCDAAQRAAPGAACAFASRATDGEEDVPAGILEPHVRLWMQRRRIVVRARACAPKSGRLLPPAHLPLLHTQLLAATSRGPRARASPVPSPVRRLRLRASV